MPSSLVFAALALAWIVVLVPMVARRRQEVRRTADSALAARVVRHGCGDLGARVRPEEVPDMPEIDEAYDDEPAQRRYRPGRGGFDPHAAELAARAKYGFRQRVVFCLLLTALASGLFAAFALPVLWWLHGASDAILVGYLGYLRRQVRIEQDIRQRRLDRAARARRAAQHRDADDAPERVPDRPDRPERPEPRLQRASQPATPPGAAIIDLDDEDPALYDLDGETPTPYRRAVGE